MKNIKNKIEKITISAIILIVCLTTISATPPIPESYWGHATLNGVPAPYGTPITVEVHATGEAVGSTTVLYPDGGYSLDVKFDDTDTPEDEGANEADPLTWKVNNIACSSPNPGADIATFGKSNGDFNLIADSGGDLPSVPILNDPGTIDNDGSYTITWSSASNAITYILEEDTSSSFNTPIEVYSGSGILKPVTGKSDGTYYYRVKACNDFGCSGWSNIEEIEVEIGSDIKALYVTYPTTDLESDPLYIRLINENFEITRSETIPEDMSEYDLVIVASYAAAWQTTADYIRNYVANGGGVCIISGVPAMFPYPYPDHSLTQGYFDISYVSEWFGTANYQNVGLSDATVSIDNPLGTDLKIGDLIGHSVAWGGAAVSNLYPDNTRVFAEWDYTNDRIFSFTHTYENGRVFYIAGWGSENSNELALAGALWAAKAGWRDEWMGEDSDGGIAVTTVEIQDALHCWLEDIEVSGHLMSTEDIQEVIAVWLSR